MSEFNLLAEDIMKDDTKGVFAVRVSSNNEQTLSGGKPLYINTVTCIPSKPFTREQSDELSQLLHQIGDIMQQVLVNQEDV